MSKHFKSLIENTEDDGTINIRLHENDVLAILACLSFSAAAAKIMMDAELKKGTTKGARRMSDIVRDSKELSNILSKHLDIGEPRSDDFN